VLKTVRELAAALPRELTSFEGSQYPLPLCQAVLGRLPAADEVRALLDAADPEDAGDYALSVAMAAECYEAGRPDGQEHFVPDARLRGLVFMGGKWRAGWAFLMDGGESGLAAELEGKDFIVLEGGDRPTAAVYWLQMMVRYAMIWGQIPPGEDHEMGHFLEEDLPGVLIVRGERTEVESWLALAMMALGCPAIVPSGFPHAEGRRAEIEDDGEVLDAIATLPNLRVREQAGERISLPEGCNPAHAREPFEAAATLGGDERSFFLVRPADVRDGVEVVGEPGGSVGVLIGIGDERLDLEVSEYLERVAVSLPGYLPGVRTVSLDPFTLGLAAGVTLDAGKLATVLRDGVKWHFPKLARIRVRVVFDEAELDRLGPEVAAFRRVRADQLAALSEQGVGRFVACIECQSFSHRHVCIVTPDRPPMCGRSPGQVKAAALFGPTWQPSGAG